MSIHPEDDFSETAPRGTQVGLVLGLWLSGVFAASLGGRLERAHEGTASMVLLGAAVLWPVLYFAMGGCRFVPRSMPFAATGGLILFGAASALSSFMSPVALLSTGYVVLTLAGIWLALQFNSNLDADQYEWGLKVFAVLMTGLLAGFAWYDYVPGTRLGNGKDVLNPNTVALVSTSVLLASMSIRTLVLRLAVMGPVAGIIVLTSSRAAAGAAVVGLVLVLWRRLRARRRPVLLFAGMALLLAVGVTIAYGDLLYKTADRFYALSSADRGISSGASGRVTAWKGTWELFVRNPVLGVGFRAHEHLLKADTSAHNGYLATLAEVGVLGFLGVLYLVVRGLHLLWADSRDPGRAFVQSILLGLCVGYILLAIFERYLINVGNPTSLLFLVSVMRPGAMEGPEAESDEWVPEPLDDVAVGEPWEEGYGHG
ncbi:O-antigen ligase family protein [Nitrospira sp. NS4]|uniref:O-antigen ligase family protein n=1 Tax=Nitrospira sp. NS4 TaxID=3414498 RepID=UPI003C2F33DB